MVYLELSRISKSKNNLESINLKGMYFDNVFDNDTVKVSLKKKF